MAYLASHSRSPILRATLAEALWPHLNPEQSAHRLHLAVSGARAALRVELPEINPIVFVEDSYGWHSSVQITSDTHRLEQCFNDGSPAAFSEGISVYAGQFLPAEQADWVTPMRVRYEHMYVTMLETLASAALEAGDYARATNFGLELIEVDGANERATQIGDGILRQGRPTRLRTSDVCKTRTVPEKMAGGGTHERDESLARPDSPG